MPGADSAPSAHTGMTALETGSRPRPIRRFAALPNVKLRLGRINVQGQQKGVDALIYRDLMTLSHERAIADAFLLSGDEDLREGVRTAQDQGVRVTVIGIATREESCNQSRELMYEADEVVTLTRDDIGPFFTPVTRPAPAAIQTDGTARHVQDRRGICPPMVRKCKRKRAPEAACTASQNTCSARCRTVAPCREHLGVPAQIR